MHRSQRYNIITYLCTIITSFGGASFSDHNRTVSAAQIARSLRYNENGYEGPRLTDEQFKKMTDTLQYIKEHPKQSQKQKL